jgi:hypothetical protein
LETGETPKNSRDLAMKAFVAKTAVDRAKGERPSRGRSLLVSAMAAGAAGVLVYRFLRSAPPM